MEYLIGRNIQMRLAVFLSILISTPAWAQDPAKWEGAPGPWFIYTVVVVVLIGSLLTLALIRAALSDSTWSLADALSEEVEVTAMDKGDPGKPQMDKTTEKPVMITEMRASSSRLIALMGMMVILLMFVGFGVFVLYSFGKTGKLPDSIDKVVHFLLAGLVLFAPYVANKFATMFESLTPKKG